MAPDPLRGSTQGTPPAPGGKGADRGVPPGFWSRLCTSPRRLYAWVLGFANSRRSGAALAVFSFAESSFFPVPPDVLLVPLALGRPDRWLYFATVCTAASVLGGVAGYAIGYGAWTVIAESVYALGLPTLTPANFDRVAELFARYDFWVVFAAGLTPIPYKVVTISAGAFALSPAVAQPLAYFAVFVGASFVGRGARFYLVAWLCARHGVRALPFIDRHFGWLTFAFLALLVGGFYVFSMI